MKKTYFLLLVLILTVSQAAKFGGLGSYTESSSFSASMPFTDADLYYHSINWNNAAPIAQDVFILAITGFSKLKDSNIICKDMLTVIDYSLSANQKRLWVIDIPTKTVLYHTYVAHGKATGEEYATRFSNLPESNMSCLGFFATGEAYQGNKGLALKLDGLEPGKNDNARNRAIVLHGAEYVSEQFIRENERLGRSHGCPAVPVKLVKPIIELIKDGTCIYMHFDQI